MTEVVYVSPLKALAVDIQQNLERPLAEIRDGRAGARAAGPEIRVVARSGDTPPTARAAMLKQPPHILITTPESLYLLLTAERSRELLRGVRTVIVDEIHALARDKRGAHLALTLERLDALAKSGRSASGSRRRSGRSRRSPGCWWAPARRAAGPTATPCTIVDTGHRRAARPRRSSCPTASSRRWRRTSSGARSWTGSPTHVRAHRTTLVFVNTRRLAERVAHLLAERLGEDQVAAHHGSLSKERRLRVEARLRAGELAALVATASLELGIDIGPVELVCQIGSPRSIATFLQRVGRSGHTRFADARGRLYPLTRDELVEARRCSAPCAPVSSTRSLLPRGAARRARAADRGRVRRRSLARGRSCSTLVRRAAPYADLDRADFDAVVELVSEGIETGRGRRAAYLHRDRVNGVLRGRRGARLAALTSGGAIPETADYRVVADPDDTFVGTVNEDFAIESMAGDVFLLGSTSWRIRRVERGVVRVVDAQGAPPTVPFWLGEAPARTAELSAEVSELRAAVDERLG